jgi:hypothetical protein
MNSDQGKKIQFTVAFGVATAALPFTDGHRYGSEQQNKDNPAKPRVSVY